MLPLPPPFRLRPIDAADQAFVDALYLSTRADLAPLAGDAALLAQLMRMQQNAQAQGLRSSYPQAEYRLLEREGEAIGRLVVDVANDHVHLVDLAIAPPARRQGAASVVLRALQTWAAQRGLPLTLSVSLANPDARRLYAQLGFVATGADALQERLQWQG